MSNNYRSRTHMLLLYPSDKSHVEALEKIKASYDYAGILHNKDYWTEADEKKTKQHVAGELKKEHWHVIIRFQNAKWRDAISTELGINANFIEEVKKFDNALLYLIHYNDTDKAQYGESEVFGTLKNRLTEIINKGDKTEGEKVYELITFIKSFDGKLTVTDFAEYCAKNGYWSEFRRSGAIFCKIIDEKNSRQYENDNRTQYDEHKKRMGI